MLVYAPKSLWSYALARFAHERGELDPRWQRQLRPDIRALFRRSLRVLSGSKR